MLLAVNNLHAGYGLSPVLHGLHLHVNAGETVALLGRNGSGRSTTAKAIMGQLPWQGSVRWQGVETRGLKPFELARRGMGYVPEGRDIFPRLTVQQNMLLGQKLATDGMQQRLQNPVSVWTFDALYELFPQLKVRQHTHAGVLSGGEQQMLALCRTLMGNPKLIMIDEPTEGLAPQLVEQVGLCLKQLQERGVAVLLIEQKLTLALSLSDRVLVLGQGRVVFDGAPATLLADQKTCNEWLSVR